MRVKFTNSVKIKDVIFVQGEHEVSEELMAHPDFAFFKKAGYLGGPLGEKEKPKVVSSYERNATLAAVIADQQKFSSQHDKALSSSPTVEQKEADEMVDEAPRNKKSKR